MIKIYLLLIMAILALSQAGNLIRFCEVDAFVLVFYRMFFALLILLPFSYKKIMTASKKIDSKILFRIIVMGIFFSLHLYFWIWGLGQTKVANAMITFSLNPVFTAIGAYFFLKEKIGIPIMISLSFSLLGLVILSMEDISLSSNYFLGDILALLGGLFFAAYFLVGRTLRQISFIDNLSLMSLVYFVATILTTILILLFHKSIWPISNQTIYALVALVLFPTIMGHVTLAYVLKYIPAQVVSTSTLIEPIVGGIVAVYLFQEHYSSNVWIGYALIICGIICLIYFENKKLKLSIESK